MTREIRLVVSIDTEEDNWDVVRSGFSAGNIHELPRLDALFERLGVRATYFTTYQVVRDPSAAAIIREVAATGRAEIGGHLHPWSTPPFDGEPKHVSMLNNYTPEAQRAKLRLLDEAHESALGARPTSFRAGRFGLSTDTVRCLIEAGYRADSSVTPLLDWRGEDAGPDYLGAPFGLYRLDGQGDVRVPLTAGPIVEVPISVGFTRFAASHWSALGGALRRKSVRRLHLAGLAARSGLVQRAIISPETNSTRDMLAVARRLVDAEVSHIQLFFHSSTLRPGLNPFVRSRADLNRFYARLERAIEGIRGLGAVRSVTVGELAAEAVSGEPVHHVAPARTLPRSRPRRILILNYHFPPDGSVGGLRWAGLSKYLARLGWDVHALVATGKSEVRDGVQLHAVHRWRTVNDLYRATASRLRGWSRVAAPPRGSADIPPPRFGLSWVRREIASLLSFPDESRGWMLRTTVHARRLIRRFRPDVVVSSGPPHTAHMAGALALTGLDIPHVLDLRDPWANRLGAWRNDPVYGTDTARFLIPRLERAVFERSQGIIANTRELASTTSARYPDLRIDWIRNGVDLERLPQRQGDPFPGLSVLYAGTLYGGRDSTPVLQGFRRFLDRHPEAASDGSRIRIAGYMDDTRSKVLRDKVAAAGLNESVSIVGLVPRSEALELLGRSSVSVVLAQDQELQVPAKLYEALALGVTTLVVAEGNSATSREAVSLGAAVCEPGDVEGIARVFEEVWSGERARSRTPVDEIDYGRLAVRLQDLLLRELDVSAATLAALAMDAPAIGAGDPLANWMWLADLPAWDRALELQRGEESVLRRGMRARFGHVESFMISPDASGVARPVTIPHPNSSFDCVAFFDAWSRESGVAPRMETLADRLRVLEDCRRVIKPGGCLFIATDNVRWYRNLARRSSYPSPRALIRTLKGVGFSRVRLYYVTPSAHLPISVIPANRTAVGMHERLTGKLSGRGVLRRGLSGIGWHDVLHPSLFIMAYR